MRLAALIAFVACISLPTDAQDPDPTVAHWKFSDDLADSGPLALGLPSGILGEVGVDSDDFPDCYGPGSLSVLDGFAAIEWDSFGLSALSVGTMECWVNNGGEQVVGFFHPVANGGGNVGIGVEPVAPGELLLGFYVTAPGPNPVEVEIVASSTLGWHHVAASWSGSTGSVNLYLDGNLLASASVAPFAVTLDNGPTSHATLIAGSLNSDPVPILLDEVRVSSEILQTDDFLLSQCITALLPVGVNWGPNDIGSDSAVLVRNKFLEQGTVEAFPVLELDASDCNNEEILAGAINALVDPSLPDHLKPGDTLVLYVGTHGGVGICGDEPLNLIDFPYCDGTISGPYPSPGCMLECEGPLAYSTGQESLLLSECEAIDETDLLLLFNGPEWDEINKMFLLDACWAGGFWPHGNGQVGLSSLPRCGVIASAPENHYMYFDASTGETHFSQAVDAFAATPGSEFPWSELVSHLASHDYPAAGYIGGGSGAELFEWLSPSWQVEVPATTQVFVAGTPDLAVDLALPDPLFTRGDADGDGVFNALADGLYLLTFGFLGGPPPPCMEAAEVDGDGTQNALADSLYILTHGFLGGPAPGAPYPDCGLDPDTASSLGCESTSCP